MAEHHKTCVQCGAEFVAKSKNRSLCSNRCKKARFNSMHRDVINAKQRARNQTATHKEAKSRYRKKIREAKKVRRSLEIAARNAEITFRRAVAKIWLHGVPKCCAQCGSIFIAHAPWGIYCKRNCRPSKRESDRRRFNERLIASSSLHLLNIITTGYQDGNDQPK